MQPCFVLGSGLRIATSRARLRKYSSQEGRGLGAASDDMNVLSRARAPTSTAPILHHFAKKFLIFYLPQRCERCVRFLRRSLLANVRLSDLTGKNSYF